MPKSDPIRAGLLGPHLWRNGRSSRPPLTRGEHLRIEGRHDGRTLKRPVPLARCASAGRTWEAGRD